MKHMEIGIRALKQNASAVVAEAAAGTTITVTDRGRPVARLTPIPASRLDQLVASGDARPPRGRGLADLPAPEPGPSLAAEVVARRGDERY